MIIDVFKKFAPNQCPICGSELKAEFKYDGYYAGCFTGNRFMPQLDLEPTNVSIYCSNPDCNIVFVETYDSYFTKTEDFPEHVFGFDSFKMYNYGKLELIKLPYIHYNLSNILKEEIK